MSVMQGSVGQILSREQLDRLPVGSVVQDLRGGKITKEHDGSCKSRATSGWKYDGASEVTPLAPSYNRLVSVGGPETLAQFKDRFAARVREVTADYTPTHRRVAEKVLASLDRVGEDPTVGTLALKGAPDEPGFTIWRWEGEWIRQYGSAPLAECEVRVGLDEFRRAAWEQGQAVKQRFKWCSVFDQVMAEFEITDPEPGPDFSDWGTLVKAQEGRDKLPVGSVIGENKGDWGVFLKTSCEHNSAEDWVRVCGTRPLAAGTMRLLWMGHGHRDLVAIRDHGLSRFIPGCVTKNGYIVGLP